MPSSARRDETSPSPEPPTSARWTNSSMGFWDYRHLALHLFLLLLWRPLQMVQPIVGIIIIFIRELLAFFEQRLLQRATSLLHLVVLSLMTIALLTVADGAYGHGSEV